MTGRQRQKTTGQDILTAFTMTTTSPTARATSTARLRKERLRKKNVELGLMIYLNNVSRETLRKEKENDRTHIEIYNRGL